MKFNDYTKSEPINLHIDIQTDITKLEEIQHYYEEIEKRLMNHEYNVQNNKRV